MTSTQLDFESAPGASSPDSAVIAVFNTLQMTGLVLPLAVILTTWLAPTVKRFPAWYNVIISWIISSSSSLLLIGRQTGTKPPFGLCLFQAMFLYVAPECMCMPLLCARGVSLLVHAPTCRPNTRRFSSVSSALRFFGHCSNHDRIDIWDF